LYFIKCDAVKCIGSGVTAPYILNQNTSWRWVVSIIPWLPHHWEEPGYPVTRMLVELQTGD